MRGRKVLKVMKRGDVTIELLSAKNNDTPTVLAFNNVEVKLADLDKFLKEYKC